MRVTMMNKYYFPPHLGGVEQSINLLARSLVKRGIDVRALVANEGPSAVSENLDGVEVRRLPRLMTFASTPIALSMPGAVRSQATGPDAADVLHMHYPYPWGEVSWLLGNKRLPTVMTYHADVVRQKNLMRLYAPILERVLERVDRIIVSAPQNAEYSPFVSKHMDKVRVIPFAIEAERFAPTEQALARAEAIKAEHSRPIVLFVGRLVYYKGVDVLVKAMAKVDADVLIVGQGPLEDELRSLASSLGISDRVSFMPPVDDEELGALYRAADVFCLPSVAKSEAFGLVQLEAHTVGTPVVSTSLPSGVPFVNEHGKTGLVVPPSDVDALAEALNTLVTDDALRAKLGEQARLRAVNEFGLDRWVDDTLGLYRELVG